MKTVNKKYARKRVHTEIVTITPALAAEMLSTMPEGGNRRLRHSHAEMLAGLIREGNWLLTHNGVAFDQEGRLIDGQHRLTAVTLADVPVQMMVTWGLESSAMDAIDRGVVRQIGDVLHIGHGVRGGSLLTSICKVLHRDFDGDINMLTVPSTLAVYRKYQPGVDWIINALPSRTADNKSAYRAAFAVGYMVEPSSGATARFIEEFRTGVGLRQTDAAYRLREFTTKVNLREEKSVTDGELFCIGCNALLAHFQRKPVNGVNRSVTGALVFRRALEERGHVS